MEEKAVVPGDKAREFRSRYLGQDLVEMLTAPTPEDWIEERPARGGAMVKYVPGPHFIERFNDCFGFLWSYRIKDTFRQDNQVVSTGQLSIKIPGRTIVREYPDGTKETTIFEGLEIVKEQFGSSEVKRYAKDIRNPKTGEITYHMGDIIDLGDDYKGAGTDAMKKCGTLLGMFLDVYGTRATEEEGITKTQLEAFYKRAERAGMGEEKADSWCLEQIGKKPKDCDSLALMGLIPKLINIAKEKG